MVRMTRILCFAGHPERLCTIPIPGTEEHGWAFNQTRTAARSTNPSDIYEGAEDDSDDPNKMGGPARATWDDVWTVR